MSTDTLDVSIDEQGVAIVTFNRPRVRNALDLQTMHTFAGSVDALRRNAEDGASTLRVVVLTGAGTDAFCSGGDQRSLAELTSEADGMHVAALMGDALLSLERMPVPTIAAINGYALGGGSEIALACDLRVADSAARLGLVHLRLSLIPGWGAGQRLLRLVGYGRAMEMLLNASHYEAQELETLGIVNHVVPVGRALPAALEIASSIAAADSATVRAVKSLLQAGVRTPYEEALLAERALFPALWAAPSHVEAMQGYGRSASIGRSESPNDA